MEYSPFVQQQNGSQPPFQLDLEPPDLHSPTGEVLRDGPLSAESSIGPSFAEAFSSPNVAMASPGTAQPNPFKDHNRARAATLAAQRPVPMPGFTFSSHVASPIDRETTAGPLNADPIASMSLDPPRKQRGHRRAQSDFFQYPQGFLEHEEGNEYEHNFPTSLGGSNNNQSRQMDLLEHIDPHIDVEELQNLLKSRSEENLSLDPKKAKRIIANRQSAARSKEKKVKYIADLEKRLQELQSHATSLNTLMSVLQKDTASLTSENKELQRGLQALEAQAQLRDGLNERLRREIMQLKQQAHQLQQNSRPEFATENNFSRDGFEEQEVRVADFLNPNGSIDSPTQSSSQGQSFRL